MTGSTPSKQFVLVVDGNARDALVTGMLLQNFGYTVSTVRTVEDAVELLTVAAPGLVVTELVFPGKTGFDLLSRIRLDPALAKIPVIVQTALSDVGTEDRCRGEGCTLYLRKPVNIEDLYRAVQSTIEHTPRSNLRISAYLRAAVGDRPMGSDLVIAVSDSGMFIRTLNPRPVGESLTVTFVVNRRTIKVLAKVLYAYGFNDGPNTQPGMGMRFTEIGAEDRRFLQEFIRSQVRPSLAAENGP